MDPQPSEETIPSTSDATQKQSSSAEVLTGLTDSPSSKEDEEAEVENEPLEECSVCRNEMTDITTLSDCVHEFCYNCLVQWLTKGTGPFCPMCKAPVKFIKRKGTDRVIPLEQIQLEKEPEATASEDLVTEKRIIAKKSRECRRLMNRIDEIIGSTSRLDAARREARTKDLHMMKQLCVAQLNSLQMLRDDIDHGAAKALIVSRPEFRRLIYERAVTVETREYTEHRVTKEEFLANIEHYRSVLNAFLTVELKALPLATQPSVDSQNRWYFKTVHDVLEGKDEEFVNKLFCLISERGVNELTVKDMLLAMEGLVTIRIATIFLAEIKSLVNSRKTFLEWCGEVLYRNNSDLQGGNRNVAAEYVTVDDSIDVDEPPTHRRGFENARPFPFSFPGHFNQHSAFFPNNRRPSSSDTDQDEDIYFQAPLRIRRNPDAFRPTQTPSYAIPRDGITWLDLTRTTDFPFSRTNVPSSSSNVPVVDLDEEDDNEPDVRSSSSSASDDNGIQVINDDNDTIVLSDSPAVRVPTERKRKSNNNRLGDLYKRSKYEELPEGLVEDVQKLITKYNMPMVQAMNMMVNAAQEAIKLNTATTPVNLLARSQNEPSTSSNLQPDDALQVAGFSDLARNGLVQWPPEKRDWKF